MNDYELKNKYEELEKEREKILNDPECMDHYYKLKEYNLNDRMCGWLYSGDAMLYDTLEELNIYQKPYVLCVLQVYINELQNIYLKVKEL